MRPLGIGTAPPRAPAPFPDAAAPLASPTAATGAGDVAGPAHPTATSTLGGSGTTATLHGEFGATTPWYRTRGVRGGGTSALSRAMNSIGVITRCVAPALRGDFTR
jgi:hypothetical protein